MTTQKTANSFQGFQWTYFADLSPGPLKQRAELFLSSVDWDQLCVYASAQKKSSVDAILLPNIGLGYNHMVRVLEFIDGARWIARLRMPALDCSTSDGASMTTEFTTTTLVASVSDIPIPFIHAVEPEIHDLVKASFMLMDCLEGNVGMDLGMTVPSERKTSFFNEMAHIHVQLSTIRLPMIGTILRKNPDGTFTQGPIPGIGGPFHTAGEYFNAWASNAKFGMDPNQLPAACGPFANEIIPSVEGFNESIHKLAERLSIANNGPFPLCHGDFGHNNIVVNDDYQVLGVIDWENAFAAPWEVFAEYPLTLSMTPAKMDAPWNYDEVGNPKDEVLIQQVSDQRAYVEAVRKAEDAVGISGEELISLSLKDSRRQDVIAAMRLFGSGKPGWYGRLVDVFWEGEEGK